MKSLVNKMWEYLTTFGVVFMTWYDNLWLKKFEKYAWKNGTWLVWELMKLQTKLKTSKPEMIKDGYHINAVYLYVYGKDIIKQFDMLRVFRENVIQPEVNPVIRLDSELNFMDFVNMCSDPDTNFNQVNENSFYLLEVNYTFDRKDYRVYYDSKVNSKIRFPIYSDKAIRERDLFVGGVDSSQITENETDYNGIDVTKEMKRLAGPMQNFYDDTEFVVKKRWFMNDRFPKQSNIQLIDFKGELHIIKPDDQYLSFDRN
jgi:hypothetical protein